MTEAVELEVFVKSLCAAGEQENVTTMIDLLTKEYTQYPQSNFRKAVLIGLTSITFGLAGEAACHLDQIIPPILNSFLEQGIQVRYYACEALYYIAKIVRGEIVLFFNQIFNALCKITADSDTGVQNAAHLLDGLIMKHAAFFDKNNDGIIYPKETYKGLRAIGCGVALSFFGAIFINMALSLSTKPADVFPSLCLPIYIANIQKGKHGSDTDAYDDEGRFVNSKFEDIWKKHAGTTRNALTSSELNRMLKANRELNDIAGWIGSWVEWRVLYHLAKDKDGLLQKETVRGVYDGSLFSKLEHDSDNTRGL